MKTSEFASGELYDFRKDFRSLAEPGLLRFLAVGDEGDDDIDAEQRFDDVRRYLPGVRDALTAAQNSGEPWSAERAAEIAAGFERAMTSAVRHVAEVIAEEAAEAASPEGIKRAAEEAAFYAAEAETERRAIEAYAAVDADAELEALRRLAADQNYLRPFGGGDGYARAMMSDHLHLYSMALQAQWGDEATATFLPIAQAARGGKDDPAVDLRIDQMAYAFVRKFMDAKEKEAAEVEAEAAAAAAASKTDAHAKARDPLEGFMFDGDVAPEPPPMLISRLLPAQGVCFNGGQSGVGKSFLLCHAAARLAAGAPFFGQRVHERVGSAIFAAEGQFTMPNRITVARQRATMAPKLPISWLGKVPNLSDPREIDAMMPRLKALGRRFQDTFNVRLGAIWLDTLSAACDIQDEDDNSEAAKVGRQLHRLAWETGTVVIPTHHYGKNQETGLRGASAWRALCDIVWSATGERNHLTGEIRDRKFSLRRAATIWKASFQALISHSLNSARIRYGDPFGACYVEETPVGKPGRGKSSGAGIVERAVVEAYDRLADGAETSPGLSGKPVKKVSVKALRDEVRSRGFLEVDDDSVITASDRGKFLRAKEALLAAKTLIEQDEMIWR